MLVKVDNLLLQVLKFGDLVAEELDKDNLLAELPDKAEEDQVLNQAKQTQAAELAAEIMVGQQLVVDQGLLF
ncbi:MAG: hypothetical protein CMF74_02910 [Maricaulis sp.]|jgi:hypothetical protein|nr:hypothetical protein [Maricaulis sp.]|tara:strand:+ start:143 stop:358 length:216 start_codon:yes stop_codon:yes gene_type:complete